MRKADASYTTGDATLPVPSRRALPSAPARSGVEAARAGQGSAAGIYCESARLGLAAEHPAPHRAAAPTRLADRPAEARLVSDQGLLVQPGPPPVAEFDPDSDFAPLFLVALMTWPHDPRRRQQFLVRAGARIMTSDPPPAEPLDEQTMRRIDESVAGAVTRAVGKAAGALTKVEAVSTEFSPELWTLARDRAKRELYEPSGGLRTLVDAPGWDTFNPRQGPEELQRAGVALAVVATLARRHPDIPASLNRAYAVIEAEGQERGDRTRTSERHLKEIWERWCGAAPLWAAYVLVRELADWRGAPLVLLGNRALRRRILAAAGWFRQFGTTFVPRGARGPLIPPEQALELRVGIPPAEPPLPPLSPEMASVARAWARR